MIRLGGYVLLSEKEYEGEGNRLYAQGYFLGRRQADRTSDMREWLCQTRDELSRLRGLVPIGTWSPALSESEQRDLAYWERNVLALSQAEGWYNDDVPAPTESDPKHKLPRYPGHRRVLSLHGGRTTFHVPDDFPLGTLPKIPRSWDGHTTPLKWARLLHLAGVKVRVFEAASVFAHLSPEGREGFYLGDDGRMARVLWDGEEKESEAKVSALSYCVG